MLDLTSLIAKAPLPDKRLRKRAHLMVQSLVRGHSATSHGLLAPADRKPESLGHQRNEDLVPVGNDEHGIAL